MKELKEGTLLLQDVATPWRAMFSSPAVWAIVVAHLCYNWGNYTIMTCIPTYMKEVLKFDIKQVGPYHLTVNRAIGAGM